ncbi:leucine-rich repeat and calponin homology domain-containing protein 2-like [Corvus hawaiiensis]|uniref:leucine-rich repeat and calponin homology domain-containing protein 2-like n=1 Tax=Corvus hawaiiensis TaxID=134902 RepID=UPI00201888BF|nr:leucine-rich repeat and calponin homology domain-containing protein 2-like [Corvus hawaiiensis]
MAAGQGGGGGNNGTGSGSGTAPGSGAAGLGIPAHLTLSFSSGPHWGAAALPQSHTVRSLERALEEAGSSGILCLSGRKLRDFPGSGCDLSDTTQAGHVTGGYRETPRSGSGEEPLVSRIVQQVVSLACCQLSASLVG